MYTHIYVYTHTCMYIHTYTHVYTHKELREQIHKYEFEKSK